MRPLVLAPCLIVATTLATVPSRGAQAADPDPAAFLAAAHAKHADLTAQGLTSFKAKVSLRRADDDNVARVRESCGFTYTFTAPDQEEFGFDDTLEAVRKPLRDSLAGLWRETTGALWFREFAAAEGLAAATGDPLTTVSGTAKATGAFQASFETAAGRLADAVFADTATRTWTCSASAQGLRVRRRDVSVKGTVAYTTTYAVDRVVNGFVLPSVVTLEANGKRTEFLLEYVRVNDKPAWAEEFDPAVVKAQVEAFEKAWRGHDDDGKVRALRDLAELDSDLASAAIAKVALRDASPAVREQAAEALGVMRRANVVPALVAALGANEKEIKPYLRIIESLGAIGDPRAVDVLSKDWWNQRIAEYGAAAAHAKIQALGRIRHASSVDALLDTFTVVSDDRIAAFKGDLVESLKKLTGQDFMLDRKAWADWWKRNRAGFKF